MSVANWKRLVRFLNSSAQRLMIPESILTTDYDVLNAAEPATQLQVAATGKAKRILLIDDDQQLAEFLGICLGRQGFETIWAPTGQAGLSLAEEMQPHLILLDLRLPDADGLDICWHLTTRPHTATIPVIVLSALDAPGIVARCREVGSSFFLRKPFDPDALLVLIFSLLRKDVGWENQNN